MADQNKKVVLVTGGSGGIGAAICQRFLNDNATVVSAQRTVDPTTNSHQSCFTISVDLSQTDDIKKVINHTIEQHGQLDVLINNAGVMQEYLAGETPLDVWEHTMAVNLRAPLLLSQAALPYLQEVQGCIVNIGSIEGLACNPKHAAYSVSKAGLHALTRSFAVDHGSKVRCNTVAPGWIDTPLNDDFIQSMPDPQRFRNTIRDIHPVGRTGTPGDVANLVAFLASDQASFICGQLFTIDGGRTVQLPLLN